ncbi:serine hydrolase [Lutibacter sp.]|uniref:serine hydrolase domain-containing protein n=1 Tax=Lutibacter sp. TaxID=1925666 RepID=UPI0025BDE091|nr:serine hydrolase [Lutibacter sp.]MCF6167668.1 beta-lactamase family protein [Lutibacter sp.]
MKKFLKSFLLIGVLAIIYITYTYYNKLDIITGYASKNEASVIFLAHRTQASAESEDNNFSPIKLAKNTVNREEKSVTATVFGLKKRTAVFREGLGAVLMIDGIKDSLKYEIPKRDFKFINLPYPYGDNPQKDTVFNNVDYNELSKAVENSFRPNKKTRAVVVIYNDQIIAEKYAEGFDKNTPILGWSMTKSITSAILGILEKQGEISVNQTNLFSEWQQDERSKITLNDLLHMNSGLAWDEDYNNISDVTKMLFLDRDMSKTQLHKPLVGEPNNSWNYSSGTTNLLSGFIRNQFKTHQEYLDFWYSALIDKIGMHSMVIETDLAGNYVGSSYGWATPRDWAKFGLLYLHNGNWNGEQLLSESWVNYTATPTNSSNGEYGAHFWLNAGGVYPNVPKDLFSCNGYQGQRVFIIPSKELVIVRMGLTENSDFNFDSFLSEIITSIKN